MKNRAGYIRIKLMTLIFLILLVVHFGTQANTVSAGYAQNHRDGARNIPLDELDARAMNELSQTDSIVLDGGDDLMADSAYRILSRQGFNSVFILQRGAVNQ
jgi:hypothetical protein